MAYVHLPYHHIFIVVDLKSRLEGRIDRQALIKYLKDNPQEKVVLFDIAVNEDMPLGWRAAWMLRHIASPNEPLFKTFLPMAVNSIHLFDDSKQREWLKIVSKLDVPQELQGILYDHCVNVWLDISKHAALRISAFQWIARMVSIYPDLISEVKLLMAPEYVDALTPGIQGTFKKLIKVFD